MDGSLATRWLNTVLLSLFAFVSLALASVGLFGSIAWTVAQRRREFGIRLALGAQKRHLLGLVLFEGGKMAGAGIAIGIAGAFALKRVLDNQLFGVAPNDPFTLLAVPVVLFVVTLFACWMSARRAARVDPIEALRSE